MTRMIYLAYPLDGVDVRDASRLQSEVTDVRNMLAQIPDILVFDPGRCWLLGNERPEPDPRVFAIDQQALLRADAVVAVWPAGVHSIGVPMELQAATSRSIPVLLLRGPSRSWALAGTPNLFLYTTVHDLVNAVAYVTKRASPVGPVARYVASEEPWSENLDPAPTRAYPDDAGYDLVYFGQHDIEIPPGEVRDVPAGVAVEWPPHTWGLLVGRSSTFRNRGLLVNTAIVDPGFRGDLFAIVRNISLNSTKIQPGERIAQIIPMPALASKIEMVRADQLSPTERGDKGFGSSGL